MRIHGTLEIDMECGEGVEAQFEEFKKKVNALMLDWDIVLDDLAEEVGLESLSMHPIVLTFMECDLEEEDEEEV